MVEEYVRRFGNLVSADNAKELSPDYAASKETRALYSVAVHEPSRFLAEKVYEELLRRPAREGQEDVAIFTAGGPGAGKTTAIESALGRDLLAKAQVVFDSTMGNGQEARRRIDAARAAGKEAWVVYVHRHPVDAFSGVLTRALETGRVIPIDALVDSHEGARRVVRELRKLYAPDPGFRVHFIDNTRWGEQAVLTVPGTVEGVEYDRGEVEREARAALERGRLDGWVTDAVYRAVGGRAEDGAQRLPGADRRTVREGAEPGRRGSRSGSPGLARLFEPLPLAPGAPAALPSHAHVVPRPIARLEDAGERIGGARKERWAVRGLQASDLEGMSGGEQAQVVIKSNIWRPDYAGMVAAGAEPQAAALVKLVYDRLAAQPRDDTPDGRRRYVQMLGIVRDVYGSVRTTADVDAAVSKLDELVQAAGERWLLRHSVYKDRRDPFERSGDLRRAERLLEQGFPQIEPWRRHFELVQAGDDWRLYQKSARGREYVGEYGSQEQATEVARGRYEAAKGSGVKVTLPNRPHLDELARSGPERRGERQITGEDFLRDFGFRGVEFGNWAASDERQRLVDLAYDGLCDLAEIVRVPRRALSLNGTLGLAFGARGSGRAGAHFEPGRLVINMTKLRGAGSLAHEWGHALDHYFGELDRQRAYQGLPRQVSSSYRPSARNVQYPANLRPEMAAAWQDVVKALVFRPRSRQESVDEALRALEKARANLAYAEANLSKVAVDGPGAKQFRDWIERHGRPQVAAREAHLADAQAGDVLPSLVSTDFYREAQRLSGASGAAGYWARPTELLARAFEAYVFDRLQADALRCDYLVHGVEETRYAKGYKGNPYPVGRERQTLNEAFDKLFAAMRSRETERGVALYEVRPPGAEMPAVELAEMIRRRFGRFGQVVESADAFRVRFRDGLGDLVIQVGRTFEYDPRASPRGDSLRAGEIVTGATQRLSADVLIRLREGSADATTLGHEELHALFVLGRLRPTEIDALWRQHGYHHEKYRGNPDAAEIAFDMAGERVAATVGRLIAERLAAEAKQVVARQPSWFERLWVWVRRLYECVRWPAAERVKERIVSGAVYLRRPQDSVRAERLDRLFAATQRRPHLRAR
jgi:hypothetical protein